MSEYYNPIKGNHAVIRGNERRSNKPLDLSMGVSLERVNRSMQQIDTRSFPSMPA